MIIGKIKGFLKEKFASRGYVNSKTNQVIFSQNVLYLRDKTLNSRESGICSDRYFEYDVVVSLTTFGRRLNEVYLAIESVMQGSMKPNRIILWIDEKIERIPVTLQQQMKRGLEIKRCKDILSYKKLIPSLKECPNDAVITIDDDAIYDFDMLERLIFEHKKDPLPILANRVHRIVLDENNRPVSYLKWNLCSNQLGKSNLNFLTGVGGVLYPPHCFSNEVFNENIFLDICKFADDVWFFSMALLNGVSIKKVETSNENGSNFLTNVGVQDMGLLKENVNPNSCRNDIQIKSVFDKYDIYKYLSD